MRPTTRLLRKNRRYTREFKVELVKLFERGKYSVNQLSFLYGVSFQSIYDWIYKFSDLNDKDYHIVEMKQSSTSKIKELEQKVKDLERMLGQKQVKIDFLEEMINVAKEELNIDIKKKSFTPRSTGSGPKPKS